MEKDFDKQDLRAASTVFFDNIFRRSNTSQLESVRYEDTVARHPFYNYPEASVGATASTKRLKAFGSILDDDELDMASGTSKVPLIVRFYDPDIRAEDAVGRTLDDILEWEDVQLETSHNYIQMLFPLPEGSIFNMHAPIITREVMMAFRERPELRGRLRESLERMLAFYGFEIEGEGGVDEGESNPAERDATIESTGTPTTADECISEASVQPEAHRSSTNTESESHTSLEAENMTTASEAQSENKQKTEETGSDQMIAAHDCKPEKEQQPPQAAREDNIQQSETPRSKLESGITAPAASNNDQSHPKSLLDARLTIVRSPKWRRAFGNWAVRFDHNHLRMTRILRSLRVLGLQDECDAFYDALKEVFNDEKIYINERTMIFWQRAVRNPLHVAPDGERVPWLKKWAQEAA